MGGGDPAQAGVELEIDQVRVSTRLIRCELASGSRYFSPKPVGALCRKRMTRMSLPAKLSVELGKTSADGMSRVSSVSAA